MKEFLKNNFIIIGDSITYGIYTTTKEEKLFEAFINEYKNIIPNESLYIDDRRHILQKANEYNFKLLLMDRDCKYDNSEFKIINNMNDILELK